MATSFTAADLVVGRVISQDEGFVLVEIAKDEQRKLSIESGDQFFTLAFIRMGDDGKPEFWKPWLEKESK